MKSNKKDQQEMIFLSVSAIIFVVTTLVKFYQRFFPSAPDKGAPFYCYCAEDGLVFYGYHYCGKILIEPVINYRRLWAKQYPKNKMNLRLPSSREYIFHMYLGVKMHKAIWKIKQSFPNYELQPLPVIV